jgi:hypothetical protein
LLNANERDLRARLKRKVVTLAVVERARKNQSARISNIKEGDAKTKFLHLRVSARRRNNYIQRIKHNNGWVTDHGAKEQVVQNHFCSVTGRGDTRRVEFNWVALHLDNPNLAPLGDPFSVEEVRNAINQIPSDKAPGPDGFTGGFLKKSVDTIKGDAMKVIESFGDLHVYGFHWLNSTNMALLPKKEGAEEVRILDPLV